MNAKQQAEEIFSRIRTGKEHAVPRPANKSVDRQLRKLVEKANNKGLLIINVGEGLYIPRPEIPEERAECNEYIAKERHRGIQILNKASCMKQAFVEMEARQDGQITIQDILGR